MTKNFTTTFTEDELQTLIENAVSKCMAPRSENPPFEIIDRDELCKRLAITEPTAIRWEKKGKIPTLRIGSCVRYNWQMVIQSLSK
jgi:hypothetical protein